MSDVDKIISEIRDRTEEKINESIERMIREIKKHLPYEAGRVRGNSVGWNSVEFKKSNFRNPAVVCTLETFQTSYSAPKIEIPAPMVTIPEPTKTVSVTFPQISEIKRVNIKIPDLPRPEDFANSLKSAAINAALLAYFTDWGVFNLWKVQIVSAILALGYHVGARINDAWDKHIGPQFKKIEDINDQINSGLSNVVNSINQNLSIIQTKVQESLDSLTTNINSTLVDFHKKIQSSLNETALRTSKTAEDAVNKTLDKLYELLSIDKGMGFTPAITRNISSAGFEFWCPKEGLIANYLAVETQTLKLKDVMEEMI